MKTRRCLQAKWRHFGAGFSLVETAIALLILGILALAIAAYWQTAAQSKVRVVERDLMERAQGAIVGFAFATGRLPCPATVSSLGEEVCTVGQIGVLPWATLGLTDAGAKQMKYGAYKKPHAVDKLDLDLTAAKARFEHFLLSGSASTAPTGRDTQLANKNGYDFCFALGALARQETQVSGNSAYLATVDANDPAKIQNIAFALAMPGLLDADGDGNRFDGLQAAQTAARPLFDQAARTQTIIYDDKVVAVSASALFANLSCGLGFSAANHSHAAAQNSAVIMVKGMNDYAFLMTLNSKLAEAAVASAASGVASAAAGVAMAAAQVASTIAQSIMSLGTGAAAIAVSVLAAAAAAAAVISAGLALAASINVQEKSAEIEDRFAPYVGEITDLAAAIDANVGDADAAGL